MLHFTTEIKESGRTFFVMLQKNSLNWKTKLSESNKGHVIYGDLNLNLVTKVDYYKVKMKYYMFSVFSFIEPVE